MKAKRNKTIVSTKHQSLKLDYLFYDTANLQYIFDLCVTGKQLKNTGDALHVVGCEQET